MMPMLLLTYFLHFLDNGAVQFVGPQTMTGRFMSNRWLSTQTQAENTVMLWDALCTYYYGYISSVDKNKFQETMNKRLESVTTDKEP